ncbi:MAG TPA: hypothetical protein VKP69_14680, partial [Isosphaeraceae bacterium]|nr:hypothetical protein [Isosphaeraceae bacterium]
CNRPQLALRVAKAAVTASGRRITVHAADQGSAHPNVWIESARRRSVAAGPRRSSPGLPLADPG